MNDGTLACTSCRRYVKAELLEVRRHRRANGVITIRRICVRCAESRARAMQAIRERQETCG